MTLYIGVDFHPHQQTVSFCNTEEGEIQRTSLFHNLPLVRSFYEQMPKAVVGIEASCTAAWFEQLMNELGHELRVDNPSLIRARDRVTSRIKGMPILFWICSSKMSFPASGDDQ